MKRKVFLIVIVFLFNIIWVNAINVTNSLTSHYNIIIVTKKNNSLINNTTGNIVDDLDVMLETDLSYNDESADIIGKKIDNYLKSDMENKGAMIAKYSIVNELDPYLVAGIILEETSCEFECSVLVKSCNNVAKLNYNRDNLTEAACFGGSYQKFNSLEDGIKAFINVLKYDFYENELTTPGAIYKPFNRDVAWAFRVNQNIEKIKNSAV